MKAPFSESSGNFLVLTAFDKIGKSDITIDYIKNLQRELNESKKLILEQQKQLKEQEKEIDNLKKSVNQLTKNVQELQRKVK
jgi:septal ring factor EnvC (AmiA/AmiB activator)